jgi:hypothetical protein
MSASGRRTEAEPVGTGSGTHPQHTPDGRHLVIDGRKWRVTDPAVPEEVAARLRSHLMSARRAVRSALRDGDREAERRARSRVHRAKLALGERGTPWWDQTEEERRARWEEGLAELDRGT